MASPGSSGTSSSDDPAVVGGRAGSTRVIGPEEARRLGPGVSQPSWPHGAAVRVACSGSQSLSQSLQVASGRLTELAIVGAGWRWAARPAPAPFYLAPEFQLSSSSKHT